MTICFPVAWENVEFTDIQGLEINNELAVTQLERYKMVMQNYVDHNCSITVSYDADEVSSIIDWILENWDDYVGVSFLYNTDPTKSAEDLGYLYLPQEVVSKEKYKEYVAQLKPIKQIQFHLRRFAKRFAKSSKIKQNQAKLCSIRTAPTQNALLVTSTSIPLTQ